MKIFTSAQDLAGAVGQTFGPGPWHAIEQDRVNAFADATGDHQWIHLDADRAAAGPYGGTIAHGYLTLSLLPALVPDLYRYDNVRMGVNYGLNRVRFPAPVKVGSKVRVSATIKDVSAVPGGVQLITEVTVESDAGGKPVCVAETVSRVYFADPVPQAPDSASPSAQPQPGSAVPGPGSPAGQAAQQSGSGVGA